MKINTLKTLNGRREENKARRDNFYMGWKEPFQIEVDGLELTGNKAWQLEASLRNEGGISSLLSTKYFGNNTLKDQVDATNEGEAVSLIFTSNDIKYHLVMRKDFNATEKCPGTVFVAAFGLAF